MDAPTVIRFDGWTLLRPSGELLRQGTRIRLQTQPLQILEELLARPGELVTREQLIAKLWPKGVVDFDTALNSAVRRLRTALGDHAETPRYIETIPRRGYRFIGQLDAEVTAAQEAVVAPVAAAVAPPVTPPVASPAAVASHLRWGMITAALLLLTAALAGVWTLRIEDPAVGTDTPAASDSAQANERYQRAQFFFQRRAPGDIALARQYYRSAIEAESGFARAWAGLAGTYWLDTVEGRMAPAEGLPLMRDAAQKALELDPGLAEAHLRLATYLSQVGDLRGRAEHLRRALELDPDDPLVLGTLASHELHEGRLDEAIAMQRQAVETDPLSGVTRYNLASMLYFAGRLDEAEAELRKVRELNPLPEYVNEVLGRVLVLQGRFDEAVDLAEPWPDGPSRQMVMAMAWHGLGRAGESEAALRALSESPGEMDRLRIAEVHAFRGEVDEAFRWLAGSVEGAPGGLQAVSASALDWMVPLSPFLRPLHSDPRWVAWHEASGRGSSSRAVASNR